jgi:hypothetical protein
MKRYCMKCGQITESEDEIKFCAHCGAPFEPVGIPREEKPKEETPQGGLPPVTPMAQAQQQSATEEPKYCAWEDKERLGFLGALFETWKESLFNPTPFFRKLPVIGGIGNPLLYAIILGVIGMVFSSMYEHLWGSLFDMSRWAQYMGRDFNFEAYNMSRQFQSIGTLVTLVISPVLVTVGVFIASGIFHLILLIFGWKKESFEATFRVVAYSEGVQFFQIIPFLGGIIAAVWGVVLYIIGLKEIHKLSVGQALLVVFLPLILCCLCCCGLGSWFFSMIGIAAGH